MTLAAVGHSHKLGLEEAAREASFMAMERLGSSDVDFLLSFATSEYAHHSPRLFDELKQHTGTSEIVGCSAMTVISEQGEFEDRPGLVVLALSSDELQFSPFIFQNGPSLAADINGMLANTAGESRTSLLLLLTDIFGVRPPQIIKELRPEGAFVPIVGGAASGHPEDESTVQWYSERHTNQGVSGALISGNLRYSTHVSPGCEPIGEPFIITAAEGKTIREIGNRPAYSMLQDALSIFPNEEIERVSKGILAGLLFDERKYPPRRGDYLTRSIESVDPSSGTVTIVEEVQPGQTIQFHVRNPLTARTELEDSVRKVSWDSQLQTPLFALYMESLGRGGRVHTEPDHDVKIIREGLGDVPIIGFLTNAEFAPRGKLNLVHNYSSVLTIVCDAPKK